MEIKSSKTLIMAMTEEEADGLYNALRRYLEELNSGDEFIQEICEDIKDEMNFTD